MRKHHNTYQQTAARLFLTPTVGILGTAVYSVNNSNHPIATDAAINGADIDSKFMSACLTH